MDHIKTNQTYYQAISLFRQTLFNTEKQTASSSRDEEGQDLARRRGHAGTDFLSQAAEGLERKED